MTIGKMVSSVGKSENLYSRNRIECPSTWKGTFDGGYLIPIFWCPILPGDTISLDTTFFCRLSTQVLPPMDNIYLDFHFYASFDRFVWDHQLNFMGEKENPDDSIDYIEPVINSGESGFGFETPFDYVGCPPGIANYDVNAKLFRHMNLIWNKWYRAELLQDSLPVPKGDGPDPLTQSDGSATYPLLPRNKRGDYFTNCLPDPYSMSSGPVTMSLGSSAPVIGNNTALGLREYVTGATNDYVDYGLGLATTNVGSTNVYALRPQTGLLGDALSNANPVFGNIGQTGRAVGVTTDKDKSGLVCDLSAAVAPTINSLRQAIALQHFLEMEQRGGSRYIELMYSAFGVLSSNRALQRPEFLGGATVMINTNVVPQTSSTDNTTPQGNLTAYSTASGTRIGFTRSFEEHGFIIGFVSARTDLTYQQGLDRLLTKKTRYDYYWNQLAHLGEQEVLNQEIFVQPKTTVDTDGNPVNEGIFGYQERYAEYRYKNSLITGKFRSSYPQSLDAYHYSQYFGSLPQLNDEFIRVPTGTYTSGGTTYYNDPVKRTLAVQSEPTYMMDCYFDLVKITEVAIDGTPGLTRL